MKTNVLLTNETSKKGHDYFMITLPSGTQFAVSLLNGNRKLAYKVKKELERLEK